MRKNNLRIGILVIFLITIVTSVSYAYYSVFFQDTRTNDDNGNTSLKTCNIAEATMIENIPDSVGSFSESDIYPGIKRLRVLK